MSLPGRLCLLKPNVLRLAGVKGVTPLPLEALLMRNRGVPGQRALPLWNRR